MSTRRQPGPPLLVRLDLSDEQELTAEPVYAKVLAVIIHGGSRLYAVTATVNGAPWYGLVHENSSALMEILC